jgi:hypothetical protein
VTLDRNDDIRLAEEDADQADLHTELTENEHMSDEEAAEAVEIRAEIEETRLEMGGTLQELGDRLDPGNLMNQAKENVREATIGRVEETAKGMSDMVMETIKRNPIPAAMAGAGLALLWKNKASGSSHTANSYRTYEAGRYGTTYPYGYEQTGSGQGGGIGSKAGDAVSAVGSTVGDAAGTVAGTAGNVAGAVGQTAQNVTGEVVERGQQAAQEVGWRLESFMQASPLAVGAIAVGAGALVGALIPETEHERQVLGDASRQVASTVRDSVDEVGRQAEQAVDEAERSMAPTGGVGA